MKKTNKTFKRFAAITSASLLAACAVAPAITIAAETAITSGSITIKTEETDHNYSAYQVFDGNLSKDDDGTITFANVVWGSGMNTDSDKNMNPVDGDNIYQDLFDLSITKQVLKENSDPAEYETVNVFSKKDATSGNYVILTSAEEVSNALTSISENIPGVTTYGDIDKVATVFAKYKGTADKTVNEITADYDGNTEGNQSGYVFSALDPGYYFVEEIAADIPEGEENPSLAEGEAKTKYLLQVAGDALVSPKADAPKVMKKVREDSKLTDDDPDGDTVSFAGKNYQLADGYNDVADYNIGDDIHFTLYGSLPTSFDNYKDYYYKFTDTMGVGLDLVNLNGTGLGEDDFSVEITDYNVDGTAKDPVELTVDQFELAITSDNPETAEVEAKGFTIAIPNLKQIDMDETENGIQTMSSKAIITVKYAAELNANAVIGNNGNPNDVYLTYSNNSNTAQGGSTDETGNTAKDYNVVFTYQLDVTKKLGESGFANDEVGTKAGFKLYREVTDNGSTQTEYAKFTLSEGEYKFEKWVDAIDDATQVETKDGGLINMIGLQDGTYKLTETLVPTGYNKMDDKTIVITANTSNANTGTCQNYNETSGTAVGNALTSLTISVDGATPAESIDANKSSVDMEITNNKGNELPGTGGIGTTIFYLGGGAMAAIGGIYLISKRRMKKSEE